MRDGTSSERAPDFRRTVPDGDTHERSVCNRCGFVAYQNPKIVVGSVVRVPSEGGILMCRRAIEPRRGYWTLPAGYMELGETPEEAARREAREEALATIRIGGLLAVYTVRRLGQVQLMHRATLEGGGDGSRGDGSYGVGEESEEVRVFAWDHIPWDDIAFPTVVWALHHDRREYAAAPHANPDGDAEIDAAVARLRGFSEG